MTPSLIPRAPKRKKQPTAEMYREQLRLAADRIIGLEARLAYATAPWWLKARARILGIFGRV